MNPKMITWARKRAGMSIEDLAERMGRDSEEIKLWETGKVCPSYSVLEQLAYVYIKITLAVFYFPEPPHIEDPINKFRRLPSFELKRLSFDTRQKIFNAVAFQESLELLLEEYPREKIIFRDLSIKGMGPVQLARVARKYLGITLKQQLAFRSSEVAFKAWRHAFEDSSVFTFKDSFEDRFISGFSIINEEYPIVYINNSNAFSRQLFTLIHELGHILFGVSGVTDFDESYIELMEREEKSIEIFCNKFASNFLVPDESFNDDIALYKSFGIDSITDIADKYCVSREVIFRRLYDHRLVNQETYELKSHEWNKEYLSRPKKGKGGNYYLTKISYLGEGYTKIAFDNYYKGRITGPELGNHLNMNSRNLKKLQGYMR